MQEQAIMLCKATGYRSAGTIEMLADGKQNFFFLEMNTRLQVEHPVTEMVSGEDLVEHMLWIAAGKKLPDRLTKQPFLQAKGWAFESRVYAEDPLRSFLPSTGPLISYKEPHKPKNAKKTNQWKVRIDSGVSEGSTISEYYDPMISKLCTHGDTRQAAMAVMEQALDQYIVTGVGNNVPFLRAVYRNQRFRDGHYGTKFIAEEYPNGFSGVQLTDVETNRLLASVSAMHLSRKNPDERSPKDADYFLTLSNPNSSAPGKVFKIEVRPSVLESNLSINVFDNVQTVGGKSAADKKHDPYKVVVSDLDWKNEELLAVATLVDGAKHDATELVLQYEGRSGSAMEGGKVTGYGNCYHVRALGSQAVVSIATPLEYQLSRHVLPPEIVDRSRRIVSPMPGTLLSIDVVAGMKVEAGQQVACVEAMKMVNIVRAPKAGIVKNVSPKCVAGAHLKVDQLIVEFE